MIVNNSNLNLSNKTNKANDIKYNYNINLICDFNNKDEINLSENNIK